MTYELTINATIDLHKKPYDEQLSAAIVSVLDRAGIYCNKNSEFTQIVETHILASYNYKMRKKYRVYTFDITLKIQIPDDYYEQISEMLLAAIKDQKLPRIVSYQFNAIK